jgi:hypothetical protein
MRGRADLQDWMKSFAQNVKDTLPEGAALPAGTQELIDSPTVAQMNLAAKNRAIEAGWGRADYTFDIQQFNLRSAPEGGMGYPVRITTADGKIAERFFAPETLAPHIERAKKELPFVPSYLGQRMDSTIPTEAKPFSHVVESMKKSEAEMSARVASRSVPQMADEGVGVALRSSRSTGRLLGAENSASAAVAGGTSNSGALRAAGAVLNLFT